MTTVMEVLFHIVFTTVLSSQTKKKKSIIVKSADVNEELKSVF